jgi:hypothetical protein
MALIKFPALHAFYDYAYDLDSDQVISYKRNTKGQFIGDCWQTSFKISGITVTRHALKCQARIIQEQNKALKSKTGMVVPNTKPVEGAPPFAYIMFSVKHECSQYFENGTTIALAIFLLQKRFPNLTGADVEILNPVTHGFVKPTVHTVTTYSF